MTSVATRGLAAVINNQPDMALVTQPHRRKKPFSNSGSTSQT